MKRRGEFSATVDDRQQVEWSDGPHDSDEAELYGLRARAYPDGRWAVLRDGAELASGEAEDMHAARAAALAEVDRRTATSRRVATQLDARRQRRLDADPEDRVRAAERAAGRLRAAARFEHVRYTQELLAALESDAQIAELGISAEQARLAKAEGLSAGLPSRDMRIASARAGLVSARAALDVARLRLERARRQLGIES